MQGNKLEVHIDKPEYFGGETVTGKAELNVSGSPLPLTGVFIRVLARETVKLSSGKRDEGFNGFMCTEKQLSGPGSKPNLVSDSVSSIPVFGGFLKNATQSQDKLSPGKYTYPIEFTLPSILPSCFRSPFGGLEYRIEARVKNPIKGGTDLVNGASLNVGGSLYDMNFIGSHNNPFTVSDSKSFMFGKGTVDVNMNFGSHVFLAGDTVNLKVDVMNSMSKRVENISVSLIQRIEYYIANRLQKTKDNTLAKQNVDDVSDKQESHVSLDFTIPVNIPETIQSHYIGKQRVGKCVRVHYFLEFKSKVKGTEFSKSAEVFVVRNAEIRNRQYSEQQFIQQQFDQKADQAHIPIPTPQPQQQPHPQMTQQQPPPQQYQQQQYQYQYQQQQPNYPPQYQYQPQTQPPKQNNNNNNNNSDGKKTTRYPPPPPVAPIDPSSQNNQQQQPPPQQQQYQYPQQNAYQQPQYDYYSSMQYPQQNQNPSGDYYPASNQGGNLQEEQPYYYAQDDNSWDASNFQMYPSLADASAPPPEPENNQQERKPAYEQFF